MPVILIALIEKRVKIGLMAILCVQVATGCSADLVDSIKTAQATESARIDSNYREAASYSRRYMGDALIVMSQGRILFEDYADGAQPDRPHRLASGTKTFWGLLAVAAAQDGLIDLDERVSETLNEWLRDPRKSRITVRQLLNFTSGLDPAVKLLRGNPMSGDKFAQAIQLPAVAEPGAVFAYGPSHLFAFGAWLQRKLTAAGRHGDPLTYLHERILDPIGLKIGHWVRDAAGNPIMPSGAHVAPHEWIKIGQLIVNDGNWKGRQLIETRYLRQIFQGSSANPAYGLTLWLNRDSGAAQGFSVADGQDVHRPGRWDDGYIYRDGPSDLVMAAGQGKQRLYIIPSLSMVILRQGDTKGGGWLDRDFLSIVLKGQGVSQPGVTPDRFARFNETRARLTTQNAAHWRSACAADIQRLCPGAEGNRYDLRRCYIRFKHEFAPDCQRSIHAMRQDRVTAPQ